MTIDGSGYEGGNPRAGKYKDHLDWCKRRCLDELSKPSYLGQLGNAIGQLNADFMRGEQTKHLVIPDVSSVEELRAFVEDL